MSNIKPYPVICAMLLCVGCFCTLFATSRLFVNPQVTPKWFGLALCAGLAGLFYVCCNRKRLAKPNMIFQHIAGVFACFALALSIQGILQYFGIVASENSHFAVTGSFDNPAGYAAALAGMLPFCFLFFNDKHPYLHYAAIAAVVLVLAALVLSGSRAGILAGMVVLLIYLCVIYVTKKWLRITLICAIVALPAILYLFGKDSADGRLLIWRCTWDMICDAPLAGHGQGAF
ncbi:MAG: O-antigen ligase family protein, partial [Bacteroidales bacterium]|nr:O-antigen ligase family protein [Bacteroidales bacterium]